MGVFVRGSEKPHCCAECDTYGVRDVLDVECQYGNMNTCPLVSMPDELCDMYLAAQETLAFTGDFSDPMPEPKIEIPIYDIEEIHHGCTVQVLTSSVTGESSVGWWKEEE